MRNKSRDYESLSSASLCFLPSTLTATKTVRMVRITFKTLQQKQFFVEAELTETVRHSLPLFSSLETQLTRRQITGWRLEKEDCN